jgi:hypothetical protein
MVTELLEGETLRAKLESGPLPIRRAVDLATQIAEGLAAAHERGIVHRDLKPDNLFVTRDGRAKILDFGLAKQRHAALTDSELSVVPTASGPEAGSVVGTVGYMSPEQVRGKALDHRSDIFSFGAVLYEMLGGRRAFRGDSAADTMSAILKENPPALSTLTPNVPPALERIVRHCLEKDPAQRLHAAHDLTFELRALSDASGTGDAARTPMTRPDARVGVLGLGSLAVVAAFLAGHFLGRPTAAPPSATAASRAAPVGAQDPFVGTWRLNVEKSKLDPNHHPVEGTMTFALDPDGAYVMNASGTKADGHKVEEHPQKIVADSTPRAVPELLDVSSVATRPDANTLHVEVRRKDGSIVGSATYTVSADRRRLTATVSGVDRELRRFEQLTVWDRPQLGAPRTRAGSPRRGDRIKIWRGTALDSGCPTSCSSTDLRLAREEQKEP